MMHNLNNPKRMTTLFLVVVIIFGINVPNNLMFSEQYRICYFPITVISDVKSMDDFGYKN